MSESAFKYAIVGGGPAGASAAQGIREIDPPQPQKVTEMSHR